MVRGVVLVDSVWKKLMFVIGQVQFNFLIYNIKSSLRILLYLTPFEALATNSKGLHNIVDKTIGLGLLHDAILLFSKQILSRRRIAL